jgi:hypothetical protein
MGLRMKEAIFGLMGLSIPLMSIPVFGLFEVAKWSIIGAFFIITSMLLLRLIKFYMNKN